MRASHPAIIEHLKSLGITAIELMPVHHFANDSTLMDKGCRTTGTTTPSASSRPTPSTPRVRPRAVRCRNSRRWSAPARNRHRGDPRRRLQPHRRGEPPGPDAVVRGIDNPAYYRLVDDDKRYYMDYTGTGNSSLNVGNPALAAADHGLIAVLGHRDARRRLPVRSGGDAGPRVLRRRPPQRVLRTGATGSDGQPGQADRRAVGRRASGYQVGNFPRSGRSGTAIPGHRARLLARRGRHPRRVRLTPDRFADLYEHTARRPVASINFVTATTFTLRDLVSYNDKPGDANGGDNNDGESHKRSWNLWYGGADGRSGDHRSCAPSSSATSSATLLLSQGFRCSATATNWVAPRAATTTATAGQRDHLGGLGQHRRRTAGVRPQGRHAAQ